MGYYRLLIFVVIFGVVVTQIKGIIANVQSYKSTDVVTSLIGEKATISPEAEKVDIQCYYECMCPYSRNFYLTSLPPVLLKLEKYIHLQNHPYGKANTTEKDGKVEFVCQHGPTECYGNKLHACALDLLPNVTKAVLYNTCMMDYWQQGKGSDDTAADKCGMVMSVNAEHIKECAKGDRGTQLLKSYGEERKTVIYHHVPHVLLNGQVVNDLNNLFKAVCAAIKNLPPECNKA